MSDTFEGGGNGNNRDKKSNIIRFPNREGGFEEVARDLRDDLKAIIMENPTLKIDQEAIDARKDLLLKEAGDGTETLENLLEASEREKDDLFQNRGKIVLYLAVALAYLEKIEKKKGD